MKTYETSTTVQDQGRVQVAGVPFAAGTQVQVTISPQRISAEAFADAWRQVCTALRSGAGTSKVTDDDIQREIDRYRTGQGQG